MPGSANIKKMPRAVSWHWLLRPRAAARLYGSYQAGPARTFDRPTQRLGTEGFCKRWHGEPVRSVNVAAGKISLEGHEQLELFFDEDARQHSLDATVDQLRDRFGKKLYSMQALWVGGHTWSGQGMLAGIREKAVKFSMLWIGGY